MNLSESKSLLKQWYLKNRRDLPWRAHKDPYLIWISEVMLQQTTVQAVIPFFDRFKESFPTVFDLAEADLTDVLALWAGLGYYSRARNLHKAAQQIAQLKIFPETYEQLIELPGFGDYTARAVASIAFGQPVGVVDGNVIRILSRLTSKQFLWWTTEGKNNLQDLADQMVQGQEPSIINQAMMELGATVCTPTSPACPLCPWLKICSSKKADSIDNLPVKRPKKETEIVAVEMQLLFHKDQIALEKNKNLPFLKGTLLPPSKAKSLIEKPSQYDFQHSITKYKIFVTVKHQTTKVKLHKYQWHPIVTLSKVNPTSLLKKALQPTLKLRLTNHRDQ